MTRIGVLFVCMGNICRSPAAEAVFRQKAAERGVLDAFSIDSCGTGGWHAGERADARMRAAASARGIDITSRARQITPQCFDSFDHVLCMDDNNLRHLRAMPGGDKAVLLMDHGAGAHDRHVPDPYYGGDDGFELVLDLLDDACAGLLDAISPSPPRHA